MKKCTLVIGRSVYVRKRCQGMTLRTAESVINDISAGAFALIEQQGIPQDVYLRMGEPRLMTNGVVEVSISATKDGKHYPAYHWITPEVWKVLEKQYSVRNQ